MKFRFFTLRGKLALVSLLLLVIPLIGFWYASQMQSYLLFAQEQALSLTAKAVATILNERQDLFESNILQSFDEQKEIHAFQLTTKIILDGLADDWADIIGQAKYYGSDNVLENYGIYEDATLNFKHIIGKRGNYYYALFIVTDDSFVLRDPDYPGLNKSDHLQIAVQGQYEGQHDLYFLSPSYRSSKVNGHLMRKDPLNFVPERYEPDILGYWRETPVGYTIEVHLPVELVKNNRISFAIADVDDPIKRNLNTVVGTSGTRQSTDLGFLLVRSPKLEKIIGALHSPSARIRIIDSRLRQRVSVGQYYGEPDQFRIEQKSSFSLKSLLKPIYAFFADRFKEEHSQDFEYLSPIEDQDLQKAIREGQPFVLRRQQAKDSDALTLEVGEPILYENKVLGTVLVEQPTNNILTEKNRIIERTIDITLLVFLVGGIVLIAFASRLSSRIRQLAMQTQEAINKDGRIIKADFKISKAQDELGDLSRSFAEMLQYLKNYNIYQEKMADNLEHEIRTPLAGISANLSNLERKMINGDISAQNHLSGMKDNIRRIESLMTNIREATSLEKALEQDEQITFDLKEALNHWVADYKQTFLEKVINLKLPRESISLYGAPNHIRQMLDKLVENAIDFSVSDSPISIALSVVKEQAHISVINEGPELPTELPGQIFDSMVSLRKNSDKKSHLGLGLYIAKLIAEFHGGSISAKNKDDVPQGVIFTILLPLS